MKAPFVKTGSLAPHVHTALQDLADDSTAMFSAVESTVVLEAISAITPSEEQISAVFRDAIAAYA